MRGSTPRKVAAGLAAVAIVAAAAGCGGDDTGSAGKAGGELRLYASEPASLLTTNGNDEPSILVVRQLYRGLVSYSMDRKAEMDVAESIESTDNKKWTVKLKTGYTFTNGEPVNADSFIRAWNYGAYAPNAQKNSYFFDRIAGAADLTSKDPDGEGPKAAPQPKAKELSGLKKVSDTEFTVELTEPFVGFKEILGYTGFAPMAEACLKDPKACNETPIGNGPYKMEGAWEHDQKITLVKNPDFKGEAGKADKLTYRIFKDITAAYTAFQAGELDVMYTVPPERYNEIKSQYGGTFYEAKSNSFTYLGMPLYVPAFKEKKVRQALSMAIDRAAIVKAVFNDRFAPASGVVSPNFDGYREGVCKACAFDAAGAKKLLDEAGGWKGGKIVLWANAGAGHDRWLQAVGDQWKKNLGVDYELKVNLQFPEYLATADSEKFTGPYRLGWNPDYPVLETYLKPIYGTGSASNNAGYSNPDVDRLIKEGDTAKDLAEANKKYNEAEDIIVDELPVLPMWWGMTGALYSDKVGQYLHNPVTGAEYGKITLK